MIKIKNICIICYGYPSEKRMINTFIEDLVNKFCDNDINCYVISPQSITKSLIRKIKINKKFYYRYNDKIPVYSPLFLSFSNKNRFSNKINIICFHHAVSKVFKRIYKEVKIDAIYSHFIYPSAISANKIGKKYNIPVFLGYGESGDYTINYLGENKTKELLEGIKGTICVSTDNRNRLINHNFFSKEDICTLPNCVNNDKFYKKDKIECRKKLGINIEDFVLIFVGRYVPIKGIKELCTALNEINNKNIKAIFVGEGSLKPNYNYTIYEGMVDHDKLVDYLCASDIFILPTKGEGCSNAILEALACGLPIISSNKSFNDDIIDDNCSIRIDTNNINEIKNAILELYKNKELRIKLSRNSLKQSKKFNLNDRAKNIIKFMEDKIKE